MSTSLGTPVGCSPQRACRRRAGTAARRMGETLPPAFRRGPRRRATFDSRRYDPAPAQCGRTEPNRKLGNAIYLDKSQRLCFFVPAE